MKLVRKYHLIPFNDGSPTESARRFLEKLLSDPTIDDVAKTRFFQDIIYKIRNHQNLSIVNSDMYKIMRKNFELYFGKPPQNDDDDEESMDTSDPPPPPSPGLPRPPGPTTQSPPPGKTLSKEFFLPPPPPPAYPPADMNPDPSTIPLPSGPEPKGRKIDRVDKAKTKATIKKETKKKEVTVEKIKKEASDYVKTERALRQQQEEMDSEGAYPLPPILEDSEDQEEPIRGGPVKKQSSKKIDKEDREKEKRKKKNIRKAALKYMKEEQRRREALHRGVKRPMDRDGDNEAKRSKHWEGSSRKLEKRRGVEESDYEIARKQRKTIPEPPVERLLEVDHVRHALKRKPKISFIDDVEEKKSRLDVDFRGKKRAHVFIVVSGNYKRVKAAIKDAYTNTNNPCAYSSVTNVFNFLKPRFKFLKKEQVEQVLEDLESFTLHRPTQKRFPRLKTLASGLYTDLQADLVDLAKHKKHNDGVTFLLTVIDIYSRRLFAKPLKSKSGQEVAEAFEEIFNEMKGSPINVYTDEGKEFYNSHVKKLFADSGVNLISTNSELKCAVVERANRTLKTRLAKYMTGKYAFKYVPVLKKIVKGINNTVNTGIGKKPVDVEKGDFIVPLPEDESSFKSKYKVGDHVRISHKREVFTKGYDQGWTREVFVVAKVIMGPPVTYNLVDTEGEDIEGAFYTRELTKCSYTEKELFKVEEIIETRVKNGKKQSKVKWLGYPLSAAKWVDTDSIINL